MVRNKIKVLYVDDEENNLISFKATFRRQFDVHTALDADNAMLLLEKNAIHVIITDQRMPVISGIEFLEMALKKYPNPVRILLTGFTDMKAVIDAVNKGKIFHYLTKPWNEEELKDTIINAYNIYIEGEKLKNTNQELIFKTDQLENILRGNSIT